MSTTPQPSPDAHVACCGLLCSHCDKFVRGSCAGCQVSPGFAACAIRKCCQQRSLACCSECPDFAAPRPFAECPKVSNRIGRFLGHLFGTDRLAALTLLRDRGLEAYLAEKRGSKRM